MASFGSSSPAAGIYETVGWYAREADFTWSRGEQHALVALVPRRLVGLSCKLELVFEIGGFVPSASAGTRTLRVSAAGNQSHFDLGAERTLHRHSMTFESLPGSITVETMVDPLSPRDFGSTDGRSLGWRLYSASITGLSDCEAGAE